MQIELFSLKKEQIELFSLKKENQYKLNTTIQKHSMKHTKAFADVNVVEEIEKYNQILKCTLCDTKIKNSVIF